MYGIVLTREFRAAKTLATTAFQPTEQHRGMELEATVP